MITPIEGYRSLTGWANERKVYFRAEFSRPFTKTLIKGGNTIYQDAKIANSQNLKMIVEFATDSSDPLIVTVGLSSVGYAGAAQNLKAEVRDFNFDKFQQRVKDEWNKELSVIDVEGTPNQKTIFYTSLYHTFIHPNNIADVNGDFINSTGERKNAADGKLYSTFSLWDTFRAAHPLFTLTQEKRLAGFINSMLQQYADYGYLPIWQLWGQETYCMIANHAIPIPTLDSSGPKTTKGIGSSPSPR